MTTENTIKVIPILENGPYQNHDILMLKNRRKRDFFGGVIGENENRDSALVRLMQEQGGLDLSEKSIRRLNYQPSITDKRGHIDWLAVFISEAEASHSIGSISKLGQVYAIGLLSVWSELWQIPDTTIGVPLTHHWKTILLPAINNLNY